MTRVWHVGTWACRPCWHAWHVWHTIYQTLIGFVKVWSWKLQLTFMIWRPCVTLWSKRSLSRCVLFGHVLCQWQLVSHYFEWLWIMLGRWGWVGWVGHYFGWVGVSGSDWDIILCGWVWVEICGVGGSEWRWVHCLTIPKETITLSFSYNQYLCYEKYKQRSIKSSEDTNGPLVLIVGFRAGLARLNLGYPENPALKPRKPSSSHIKANQY